jgi:uncharacterized protein (DUF736 family)
MPRRIKPRLGWRYPGGIRPGVADDELRAAYSEAFTERIAEEFKIPTEARPDLRETALRAGAFYKQNNLIAAERPKSAEVRAYFERIQYHASGLLETLEEADDISRKLHRKFEEDIQEECVFQRSSTAMQDVGALKLVDRENDLWEMQTTGDLPPLLRLTGLICQRAERELPTSPRRREGEIALCRWTRSLCDLWEDKFRRRVTFDQANPGSSAIFRSASGTRSTLSTCSDRSFGLAGLAAPQGVLGARASENEGGAVRSAPPSCVSSGADDAPSPGHRPQNAKRPRREARLWPTNRRVIPCSSSVIYAKSRRRATARSTAKFTAWKSTYSFDWLRGARKALRTLPTIRSSPKSRSGKDVEVGSAWRKTIRSGAKVGEEFLTLTIDDPSFPSALNVAAFKNGRPGEWDVGWRRRQDRPSTDAGDQG